MKLALNKIRIDGGTQPRERIDADYVEELMAVGKIPPVIVYFDGKDHWLADGFHRYLSRQKKGDKSIEATIKKGTVRDAILYSVGANTDHGLRRTNADKRHAVLTLLRDAEWGKRTSRWIADKCAVSNHLVDEVRGSSGNSPIQREARDGRKGWAAVEEPEPETPKTKAPVVVSDIPMEGEEDDGDDDSIDTTVPAAEPTKDATGRPIQDMAIVSIFNRARELEDLARKVSDIKSLVTRSMNDGDELFAEFNLSQFQADCNNLHRAIRFATPHAVCRYCNGERKMKTCKCCKGRGWVGEAAFDRTPEEMK